ncbi:MAG: PhzF family phenazine biosynthesis protein [Methylococcales bacterium]
MDYRYYIADVFTDQIFQGAQIAVFPDAQDLSQDTMLRIAKELNLSETVFVIKCTEEADNQFRLRTFSPQKELDFGGHPLIAAAWVLASIGKLKLTEIHTPVIFEQSAGTVTAYVTAEADQVKLVQFTMPVVATVDRFVPTDSELASILSLDIEELENKKFNPMLVFCGKKYLIIPIRQYTSIGKARFNFKAWSSSSAPSTLANEMLLVTSNTRNESTDFHARLVGPDIGLQDDPPIGSSIPAFCAFLREHQQIKKGTYVFMIDRGTEITRKSVLNVEMDNKPENLVIRVGGPAVLVCEGTIKIPAKSFVDKAD